MEETRKVTYGVERACYVPITTSGNVSTFGEPIEMLGCRSVEVEETVKDTRKYADNVAHLTIPGTPTTEGTLKMYQVPESYSLYALGYKKMTNGMLVNTGVRKPHALMFIMNELDGESLEENPILMIYYNGLAQRPKIASNTKEEEVEPNEIEIPYSFSPSQLALDDKGIAVTQGEFTKTAENAKLFDKFMEAIILPTTDIPTE